MGKNQKKKGKGAEKTTAKTDKKLTQKIRKQLALAGEDDIETILVTLEKEEQKKLKITEKVIAPPYRRVFFTLTAHPYKDELIMFGGEFHNGQETFVYNDLFIYKISRNEWTMIQGPGSPPPRSSHQAVAVGSNKGELWIFGGEYTTKTESQFYHYNDLWVLNLDSKQWTKVKVSGGPSSRSGHRMVCVKRQLLVFGGYHDNIQDYKYFNDLYAFNLDERKWAKLEPSGASPCPRSGCQMAVTPEGKVIIWGGYSKTKLKKDVDTGIVHNDMFLLSPDKGDISGLKWKWSILKPGGVKCTGKSGISATFLGERAYTFGGALDQESEEEIITEFYNELHTFDLKKIMWNLVEISGKKNESQKPRRRKKKESDGERSDETDEEIDFPVSDEVKESVVQTDGVFTMTVGPSLRETSSDQKAETGKHKPSNPHPRINCGLVIKGSKLYLYGGLYESGNKQYTLSDFYYLDIHKLDEWTTLIPCEIEDQEWKDSESEMDTDDSNESDSENSESNENND